MNRYFVVFFVTLVCGLISLAGNLNAATDADKLEKLSQELEQLSSSATTLQESLALVAEYVKPSVVSLTTVKTFKHPARGFHGERRERGRDPFHDFYGKDFDRYRQKPPEREFKAQSLGSGVIVKVDGLNGYILTNNHVVENMEELKVKLGDKREYDAVIIGTDPQTDLAVVKIEAENLIPVKMGDSDKMKPGQWAIAVGNPFGLSHTVSVGVISATGRSGVGIAQYEDFLQTDAAINPGNSGGPLVNIQGEMVGINTAIFTRTGGYQGIGFAIPVNMAKAVLRDLINTGKVTRGWLGVVIQNLDPSLAKQFDVDVTEGVLIGDVQDNSPAKEGGFKRGDIVIEYDNKEIGDLNQLRNMVAQTVVGKEVGIKVLRDGKEKILSVKIGEQPADMFAFGQSPAGEDLGLTVQDLTEALADSMGYEGESGVLVSSVEPGSEAALADIKEGDLIKEANREKISNVKEFTAALKKIEKGEDILFLVQRGMHTRFVIIKSK
ncbi:MAG: DegQ family serine endoprotease [Candidatus Scalindua sp. SCAELEC01]|nr:MAG: DegQ family serine endoprotease [Candidatus Scalindua sp.]NOG84923.1 DegQ family serine endoprotease [Planctomycetota bacterium]RZV84986.1 MAG: DegQ family serine endoprotease [Candidatus Scalindua sp. SCAELEC01]